MKQITQKSDFDYMNACLRLEVDMKSWHKRNKREEKGDSKREMAQSYSLKFV